LLQSQPNPRRKKGEILILAIIRLFANQDDGLRVGDEAQTHVPDDLLDVVWLVSHSHL